MSAIPEGLGRQLIREIIDSRRQAVAQDPSLKIYNRWDQSDVFYNLRKKLDSMGYDVSALSDKRKELTKYIKEHCDKLAIRRHEIGIFAADRAVMAFQGQTYAVSFENYQQLAQLGVDIVCVEKEGIVDKLVPFTTGFGIALVQSEGFVAEFGDMLAQEANKQGANVCLLTDFDSSGLELAYKIEGITRLGINLHTVDELNDQKDDEGNPFEQLDPLDLSENYNGANHWIHLSRLSQGKARDRGGRKFYHVADTQHNRDYIRLLNTTYEFTDGSEQTYIDFIKDRRIELNTIVDEIGAQRFWNWLKDKLIETFPTRNYNRAIEVPSFVLTPTMQEFQDKLEQKLTDILQPKVDATKQELSIQDELIDTNQKFDQINEDLGDYLQDDDKVQKIDSMLKKIIKEL